MINFPKFCPFCCCPSHIWRASRYRRRGNDTAPICCCCTWNGIPDRYKQATNPLSAVGTERATFTFLRSSFTARDRISNAFLSCEGDGDRFFGLGAMERSRAFGGYFSQLGAFSTITHLPVWRHDQFGNKMVQLNVSHLSTFERTGCIRQGGFFCISTKCATMLSVAR